MAKFDMHEFVRTYAGPKLRLLMTGVGSYASGIVGIPGASEVVDSISIPYSRESVGRLLKRLHPSPHDAAEAQAVSAEMVTALHLCNCAESVGTLPVTITGAISTTRYRRGDNHAYIAFGMSSVEVYHLKLDKLSEAEHTPEASEMKRYVQDRIVCECALAMATGTSSDLVDELQKGGFLARV